MAEIRWTEQALEDIEAIADYISRDSVNYARITIRKIFEAAKNLSVFPESGRNVPEIGQKNIKEIILGNYRIIYRFNNNVVEIITVYHSARLLDSDLI